jgi:hypothetical protein
MLDMVASLGDYGCGAGKLVDLDSRYKEEPIAA